MLGIIACILLIGLELAVFNMLLNTPSADRSTSGVFKFCSGIWPGIILFSTVASLVTLSLCWWFKL